MANTNIRILDSHHPLQLNLWVNEPCARKTITNSKRIYMFAEMDADHVTAWSNGGSTDLTSHQIISKTRNRKKSNKYFCNYSIKSAHNKV